MSLIDQKSEIEETLIRLQTEAITIAENAINYEEYDNPIVIISETEYEWDDAKEQLQFEHCQSHYWILQKLLILIDEAISAGDDKKKRHVFKRETESCISELRSVKKHAREVIESEQQVIERTDAFLGLLDRIRGK